MSIIEHELELGIMILAYIHAGEIDITCNNCSELRQEQLNCNNLSSTNIVFSDDKLGEFYNCPLKWLSVTVYDWYDEYYYLKNYPASAPSYNDCKKRYWECVKIYESTLNGLQVRKSGQSVNDQNKNELHKLKMGFDKRHGRKKN